MCECQKFARRFVILTTAIFLAFGVTIMALGIYGMKNGDSLQQKQGLSDDTQLLGLFSITSISVGIMVVGIVLTITALSGLIGAIKRVKVLLSVYSLVLFLVVAVQITLVGLLAAFGQNISSRVADQTEAPWECWAKDERCDEVPSGIKKEQCESCIISFQQAFECCGYKTCAEECTESPNSSECTDCSYDPNAIFTNTLAYGDCAPLNAPDVNPKPYDFTVACKDATKDALLDIVQPVFIVALVCGIVEAFSLFFTCMLMCKAKDGDEADDLWASPYHY